MYVWVSGGKCLFFGNFSMLCFLETPVLRFALLPYYRRLAPNILFFKKKVSNEKSLSLNMRFSQIFNQKQPRYVQRKQQRTVIFPLKTLQLSFETTENALGRLK